MRITKTFHWHSRILVFSQCFQVASINGCQENTFEHKKVLVSPPSSKILFSATLLIFKELLSVKAEHMNAPNQKLKYFLC